MSVTTSAPAAGPAAPRRPALPRDLAMRLARDEYALVVAQLRDLPADAWTRPTACPGWDVHDMVCHVLGMAEFAASPVEQMRQARAAKKAGGLFIDALTGLQVRKHQHRSSADLVTTLAAVGPKAARGRARVPGLLRSRVLREQPVDETGASNEPWTVGYLLDVIATRDTWMHRSDIAAATGCAMRLTPDHDGVLVADVATEWAQRHGRPCTLTLTGPAGGSWTWGSDGRAGSGGPSYELDAVEFCRIVSGRGQGEGLLATRVPF